MKSLFTLVMIYALAATGASAQSKLWTWTGKVISGCRSIEAIAMNRDGSGAFVLEETDSNEKSAFLLVWVNKKGKVLLTRKMAVMDYTTAESQQWELAFAGPGKLIASNGQTVQMFIAGTEGAAFVKAIPQKNAMLFCVSNFGGWVDISQPTYKIPGKPAVVEPGWPGYVPAKPPKGMINAESLTAWRF